MAAVSRTMAFACMEKPIPRYFSFSRMVSPSKAENRDKRTAFANSPGVSQLNEFLTPTPNRAGCPLTYIHSRFNRSLRNFLMRSLRNQADVDDFAQEVYLRIAGHMSAMQTDRAQAFVFTIAKNLLCDRSRRLARKLQQASVPCDETSLPDASLDPAGRMLDNERLQQLVAVLHRSCGNAQRAFMLSRVDGFSYGEIAEKMDVSVSMVEKHISSVLRALDTVED